MLGNRLKIVIPAIYDLVATFLGGAAYTSYQCLFENVKMQKGFSMG